MFEVYLNCDLVFEGTKEEAERYCTLNEWDEVLNCDAVKTGRLEAENRQHGYANYY